MPEEVFVLALVSITAGVGTFLTVFFAALRHRERKLKALHGDGVRASELQAMIERAVADAAEPLRAEIHALSEKVGAKVLPAAEPRLDIAGVEEEADDEERQPSFARHRTR